MSQQHFFPIHRKHLYLLCENAVPALKLLYPDFFMVLDQLQVPLWLLQILEIETSTSVNVTRCGNTR